MSRCMYTNIKIIACIHVRIYKNLLAFIPQVQKWYNKNSRHRIRHGNHQGKNHHPREKLTLLVDCAGCANSIHPITFSQSNTVITNERKDSPDLMRDDFHQEPLDTSGQVHSEAFAERDENEIPFLVLGTILNVMQ